MATYGGIDLGGTKIQAVVVAEDNSVLGSARRATPTEGGPPDVLRELEASMRDAVAAAEVEVTDLAGVGVGTPGRVEDGGNVTEARNLPGWQGSFPLGPQLARALGVEVKVGNDVHVATDAEFRLGAGRLYDSLMGVFWGTGVGSGLILDRKLWRGRGGAGEIGHMVVEIDGARCTCGRKGCVEAYAGRAAMERHAQKLVEKGRRTKLFEFMHERGRTRLTSGVWARALEHGDKLAVQLMDRAVRGLAAGIASAQNLLDVEGVIVGGGLGVRLGHPYAKRIAEEMQPHLFADSHPPHVHVAALGDLGGAIGAALLLRREA
jgi:glucokinase